MVFYFFFFQAEDGIRDDLVTGVQTCALPISSASTKNQRLCVLTSFYRFASAYEINGAPIYQKVMPTQGLRYLKPDAPYRSMSTDELKRFFAAIATDTIKGNRDYALLAPYFWPALS